MDPQGYRPQFHIWKLTQMRVDHIKDLRICHRSATECYGDPRTGLPKDRLAVCQSVAYTVRSGYVLADICWHRGVTDERDATRTSRMGIQTIRTLTDELRMRYGRAMDTKVKQFDFSVMA